MPRILCIALLLGACAFAHPPPDDDAFVMDAGMPSVPDGGSDAGHDSTALDAALSDAWERPDTGVSDLPVGPTACGSSASPVFRIDARHRGWQPNDTLQLPLARRWTVELGRRVSYPVVACGRVYLTLRDEATGATTPTSLVALDAATGAVTWGPIELHDGPTSAAMPAYDDGHVLVAEWYGAISSFDPNTGALQWQTILERGTTIWRPPVALGGTLYVTSGVSPTVYALDEADGSQRWMSRLAEEPQMIVDDTRLFLVGNHARAVEASTGATIWDDPFSVADSSASASQHAGRLYVRGSPGRTLDAATGADLGPWLTPMPPAFDEDTGYFVRGRTVVAVREGVTTPIWRYESPTLPAWGLLVIGRHVVVTTLDAITVLDRTDGRVVDRTTSPAPDVAQREYAYPLELAAAGGMLFVPTRTGLVAY